MFVENSQTPKSSSKTLNVVRGKNLIKKLFSIPNTTRREKQSTTTVQFYTQKAYRGLIITELDRKTKTRAFSAKLND